MKLHKYPRTPHVRGSRTQPGDEDLDSEPWETLLGRYVVAEEKLDGANAGMSFDGSGKLLLQSRGHYLTGGGRETQFDLFKQWAYSHAHLFLPVLGSRYILYGEWLFAKHTVFYDRLPEYFFEFDIFDTEDEVFLSTARRREMLQDLPVQSVPVLFEGILSHPQDVLSFIGPSRYKSPLWKENLDLQAMNYGLDPEQVRRETDSSDTMEGLYLKIEEEGIVPARFKYVRADFLTAILDSGTHWQRRPILPNMTAL